MWPTLIVLFSLLACCLLAVSLRTSDSRKLRGRWLAVSENDNRENGSEPGSQSGEGSVSGFLRDARLGRVLAIERLTEKYLCRLESFANSRMAKAMKQVEDEQDIAINVLNEFFTGMMNGKYEGLRNREQLWRLLAKITVCRVIDHYDKYTAEKRGNGEQVNLGHLSNGHSNSDFAAISEVSIDEIDPQLSVALTDSYHRLLELICDQRDKEIVQLNLEGCNNQEIAVKLHIGERTVRNRLEKVQLKLIAELKR